jgi:VanZ family protein
MKSAVESRKGTPARSPMVHVQPVALLVFRNNEGNLQERHGSRESVDDCSRHDALAAADQLALSQGPRKAWRSVVFRQCSIVIDSGTHKSISKLRQGWLSLHRGRMKNPSMVLRSMAWAGVVALAVASWTPGQEMVRTGFNTRFEHTLAYLIAGIAVIVAYSRMPIWSIAAILCAYAGILEFGQMYIPGRHAALLDWLASSAGVLCACLTVLVFQRRAT